MNNYMNNPFMDMFKQSFEGPMNMWNKGFGSMNWMEEVNKMAENLPWLKACGFNQQNNCKNAFNFGDHAKGMEAFSELTHLALENTQAMLHRQAEIIQRHSTELYKAMQEMASSNNHTNSMEAQQEFMRSSFESMVNDFKELAEMYSKASLETFEAASCKMSEHMKNCHTKKNHSSSAAHKDEKAEHSHSKAYNSKKK